MPDGPGPWGTGAASGGDAAPLAFVKHWWAAMLAQALATVPAGSPTIGRRVRTRTVLSPDKATSSTKTKPDQKPYISPPSADIQAEGEKGDHEQDSDLSTKEHIARLVEQAKDQAKEGRTEAFGEIYRHHHDALFRYARYRLGKEAAEDAVAETFLRAMQGLPRYRATGAPFVSWLYGIARHVVVDAGNAERRVEPRGEFPDYSIESVLGTVDHIALKDAIAALPQKQRQVIELKFFFGLTNEEVGAFLNKSPGAVNAQQWRALESLKKLMERR